MFNKPTSVSWHQIKAAEKVLMELAAAIQGPIWQKSALISQFHYFQVDTT
jgi:hypothetical protein